MSTGRLQQVKQRRSGKLLAALQGVIEQGEQVRSTFPGTTRPALPFLIMTPWIVILMALLFTFSLGVLGILVLAIVGGVIVGTISTLVTRRYQVALVLTDRRLVWVPWNGKTVFGQADALGRSQVRVTGTKGGMMGTTLSLRWADGSERRITAPRLWNAEAAAIAQALSTDAGQEPRPG